MGGIPADAFRVAVAQVDARLGAVADQVDSQFRAVAAREVDSLLRVAAAPEVDSPGRGEFQQPAVDSAENLQLPHLPVVLRGATSAGRD